MTNNQAVELFDYWLLNIVRHKDRRIRQSFLAENLFGDCPPRQVFSAGRGILVIGDFVKLKGHNMKDKVEKVLAKIRVSLQQDGGDIELVGIENGVVKVRLKGACSGCPMSQMTMANFVEAELRKDVPEVKRVQAV